MILFKKPAILGLMLASTISFAPAFADHHDHEVRQEERQETHDNWETDRAQYRKHWHHMARAHQKELDAEMRQQWLAYHHNEWKGSYNWSNYNDPAFLDYLHSNNPGLLTRVRSAIGF
ncbi:MAG TPA: hypothetical protein V6C69_10870 [Trichormus sp.]|jgi:hypothetical protein